MKICEFCGRYIITFYQNFIGESLGFCILVSKSTNMFTGLKHLHLLLIVLFVTSIIIKAILLIANQDKFDAYRKKTKVPEMIITMLFLVTGIIMGTMKGFGNLHFFFHIKLTVMVIAIPLAIIGFKKKNKALGLVSAMLFVITVGLALKSGMNMKEVHLPELAGKPEYGKALYEANCTACHGEKGAKQLDGAADLTATKLTEAYEVGNVIKDGLIDADGVTKMNPFNTLDSVEVKAISEYVITLKK